MQKTLEKIQLKNIPSDWEIRQIKDVFNFLSTATYSRADLNEEDETQYLHYGDIHTKFNFHLNFEKNSLYRISDEKIKNYALLKDGDLILADASEDYDGVGKGVEVMKIGNKKAIAGLHTFLLREKADLFADGYKGFLPSCSIVREQFYRFATGTKVYSLSKESLGSVQVLIPPLPEQKAIAECLTTWDDAIEKQTQLIAAKEQRKKALMQQLLSGKKRLPGFDDKWRKVKVRDIGTISSAGVDKKINEDETPIRLLNYLDVYRRDFIYSSELSHWVTAKQDKINKCSIRKGDIFFTPTSEVSNDIAISAVVMEDIPDAVYSYHIVRLRLKENWDLKYRAFAFKTDSFFKQSQRLCDGGGQRYVISQENFRNMTILVPSLDEQKEIGEVLFSSHSEIILERQKLAQLQLQKKALMQQLLTGKTRLV